MTTTQIREGDRLWEPTAEVIENANITDYMRWLAAQRSLYFDDYAALWRWSVDDVAAFWGSLWEYFDIRASRAPEAVLASAAMPGAQWFVGAELNYAENIFRRMTLDRPAALYKAEDDPLVEVSWPGLYDQVNRLAAALRAVGVQRGDRVVAFLPNTPAALVGVLAAASLGAIWSSCSPDFGSRSVLDRFTQIEPKVLLAVDGYKYGGQVFDRRDVVAELQSSLPSLEHTILVPFVAAHTEGLGNTVLWEDALASADPPAKLAFEQVPFDHPLWVLYSSGTTGLPKPIVQGHGGILLEQSKVTILHNDLKPGDRFFWYTSTGWMMWNYVVGSLLSGATAILYNGSPAYPDMNALWRLAEETEMTYFGTSAAFISACMKAGITPNRQFDLSRLRAVGSTGSPLSVAGFGWVYDNVNGTLALESVSGGTDLCTAFVGGARILPIYAGEIQGPSLGAKVFAYNESGEPVEDEVGELVVTAPMPSMPLFFWNDPDNTRYKSSYFDTFPGVWRHGDWIKINARGGCIIYGRSDS
ncbi:MAG: acetoacetate--CoA ligase, partial [Anaerolineales bacterium]